MHPNFLHQHVKLDCDAPSGGARNTVKNRKRRHRAFWHRSGYSTTISDLRNTVTKNDLDFLLSVSTRASNVSDVYLNQILGWDIPTERCAVRFSERFSAVWVQYGSSFVWFCVVDGEFIVFSLKCGPELDVTHTNGTYPIPQLSIPRDGVSWIVLQQLLVDIFESDDEVRAISAAVIVSCTATGKYSGVTDQMLPAELQMLNRCVIYDAPVDDDIVTVLADPRETCGRLVFQCGAGYWTESKIQSNVPVLRRIQKPKNTIVFRERGTLMMPLLFH